jgi:hypothetical protein
VETLEPMEPSGCQRRSFRERHLREHRPAVTSGAAAAGGLGLSLAN